MPKVYTNEENQVFLEVMEDYRERIAGESPKDTEKMTRAFAQEMINISTLLSDRSQNGIAERLVYFDNLLAGVVFPFNYYLKSTYDKYYGKLPRKNNNKEPNKWKTQHETRREN